MNRLRTSGQARISFFSFQDIITSVTGILILVTLMLSFSLKGDAVENPVETELAKERERLQQVEQHNRDLQSRLIEAAALPDQLPMQAEVQRLRQEASAAAAERVRVAKIIETNKSREAEREKAESLRADLAELANRIEELKLEIARSRTNANVLFVIPDAETARARKSPLAIVVSGDRLRAQRLDGAETQEINPGAPGVFDSFLERFNPATDFFVFYFRPSGAKWFDLLRQKSRNAGFEIGYDAVEETKQIVFSPQ